MTAASSRAMASDPYDILLGHNRWAIRTLLEKCEALTPEQFHQRFDIGPGSLHDTLTHTIGAIFRWSDRIEGVTLKPSIEGRLPSDHTSPITRRTVAELRKLNEEACEGFARVVTLMKKGNHLSEVRTWTFGGDSYQFTVAAAIVHVTNHGMHHRAQCMNMLKRLGRPVDADLDELEWLVAGEP